MTAVPGHDVFRLEGLDEALADTRRHLSRFPSEAAPRLRYVLKGAGLDQVKGAVRRSTLSGRAKSKLTRSLRHGPIRVYLDGERIKDLSLRIASWWKPATSLTRGQTIKPHGKRLMIRLVSKAVLRRAQQQGLQYLKLGGREFMVRIRKRASGGFPKGSVQPVGLLVKSVRIPRHIPWDTQFREVTVPNLSRNLEKVIDETIYGL
jgi:hypothetical protein